MLFSLSMLAAYAAGRKYKRVTDVRLNCHLDTSAFCPIHHVLRPVRNPFNPSTLQSSYPFLSRPSRAQGEERGQVPPLAYINDKRRSVALTPKEKKKPKTSQENFF